MTAAGHSNPVSPLDERGLASLYDLYSGQVFGLAMRMLSDRAIAEEVTQDVFIAAWRSRARLEPTRPEVRSWLLVTTRNRAIDQLRGRRGWRHLEENVPDDHPSAVDVEAAVAATLDRKAISSALEALPVAQRQAVEQAFFEGRTAREIAFLGRVPLSTVKGRMRLALGRLARDPDLLAATARDVA